MALGNEIVGPLKAAVLLMVMGEQFATNVFKHLDDQIMYDYAVMVKLNSIMVSPDETKDTDEVFNKRISDGFEYVLDANGNVMKDTAGNDINCRSSRILPAR